MRFRLAILAGVVFIAVLWAPTAGAQPVGAPVVVPIQVTGPPAERLNLIILGDGYQAHEMDKFRADVDRNQNIQWAAEPFKSYRHYFNVYRVEIVSPDSGVRCDPDDQANPNNNFKNTALHLWYSDGCTNPLSRGTTYGPIPPGAPPGTTSGDTARTNILNTYVAPVLGIPANSQNVQTLAIFNTFTYGGIGGTHATTSGGAPQGPLISLHELGHSLGQMADEYPYSSREIPGGSHPNSEPSSFHHSRLTHDQMVSQSAKWFRWLCEESLSGGIITTRGSTCGAPHEGGVMRHLNVWRPSEHSMMRWIGFQLDQIGREHMTYRITGRRNANAMTVLSTPTGQVGPNDVVWVETGHPKDHELTVTWRVNGVVVPGTNNSRNLPLAGLGVVAGDAVQATVQDQTEFVRDPSFLNGPRLTQTRSWTVGNPLTPNAATATFTSSTPTDRPVAGDEVVFTETAHPTDRVLDVAWALDGNPLPNPHNSRNLDLGALGLAEGTYALTATVTDPADPGGASQTLTWTVDNVMPTAPATLSEPVTTIVRPAEPVEYVYTGNGEFTMGLDLQDDQPGYVVGEFQLDGDGWFTYFGFPDQPFGTPFKFAPAGTSVKALTYGNLGTGGLSKATFEQAFPDFVPGWGRHTVEHRATDAAGNIGPAGEFVATVLPVEVTPGELSEALVEEGFGTASFSIRNTLAAGGRSFDWTFSEAPEHCGEPADVSWLGVPADAATTPAGASAGVDVTFDAAGLTAPDVHTAKVCIEFEGGAVLEVPVSLQVQYPFVGFLATFENPPVVNTAHSTGVSTFHFKLGGDRGLDVLADGSPVSRQVDCDTGEALGDPVPAEAPAWAGLAYSAYQDRYNYPWKPPKGNDYAGTCREFVLTLDDASVHTVLLRYVK